MNELNKQASHAWFRTNNYYRLYCNERIWSDARKPSQVGKIKYDSVVQQWVWNQNFFIRNLSKEQIKLVYDKLAELNK